MKDKLLHSSEMYLSLCHVDNMERQESKAGVSAKLNAQNSFC